MEERNWEFLEGFDSRMNIIGAISSFVTKIVDSSRYSPKIKENFGQDEIMNIAVATLCYLLDKTIIREGTSIIQIRDFLKELINIYYKKDLDDETVLDIARFIVVDVFMGSGEHYKLDVINFEKNIIESKYYQLVKDKVDKNNKLIYMLSNLGNDILLRTKEIDQHLQISMNQIVTKEFIRRKDFKGANAVARDLLIAINMERQRINEFIDKIRTSNVLAIEKGEYRERIDGIFDTLEDQKDEFDSIIELLNESEKEFINLGQYDKKVEEFMQAKETLNQIRQEHLELFEMKYKVSDAYKEALNNAMSIGLTKRFDFNDTILAPIQENIVLLENILQLFRPLLSVNVPKHFNIFKAFEEQQISEDTKATTKSLEITEDNTKSENKAREIIELNKKYMESLKCILDFCIANKNEVVDLRGLLNSFTRKQMEDFVEVDDGQIFFKVITLLYTEEVYDIRKLLEKEIVKDENFNIEVTIRELLELDIKYKEIKSFAVFTDDTKNKIRLSTEIEREIDGFNKRITRDFEITNYKFKVVL